MSVIMASCKECYDVAQREPCSKSGLEAELMITAAKDQQVEVAPRAQQLNSSGW